MVQTEECREQFEENLLKWAHSIITYSKETQLRNSAVQTAVAKYAEDSDAGTSM